MNEEFDLKAHEWIVRFNNVEEFRAIERFLLERRFLWMSSDGNPRPMRDLPWINKGFIGAMRHFGELRMCWSAERSSFSDDVTEIFAQFVIPKTPEGKITVSEIRLFKSECGSSDEKTQAGEHVHCELIKAWADGAKIEYSDDKHYPGHWFYTENPSWDKDTLYRIKRETVFRFGKELPKPVMERQQGQDELFYINFNEPRIVKMVNVSENAFRQGVVFENEEDAKETLVAFLEASLGFKKELLNA